MLLGARAAPQGRAAGGLGGQRPPNALRRSPPGRAPREGPAEGAPGGPPEGPAEGAPREGPAEGGPCGEQHPRSVIIHLV